MYLPEHFREEEIPVLHGAIRECRLATLVTVNGGVVTASHVPLTLDSEPAPYGTIYGHLARANGQWRDVAPDTEALAIFQGPDAYITPSWYAAKRETGKVVPTWNYVAVHAYGRVRFFDDAERLRGLVRRLTEMHEGERAAPWAVADAPVGYIDAMLKAIVGVELPISRLEGKWKMNQNRQESDIEGVMAGLEGSARAGDRAVAGVMAAMKKL